MSTNKKATNKIKRPEKISFVYVATKNPKIALKIA